MQVNIAKSAGFCFGVKRALDIAFKTSQDNMHVVMLGDIVHNEDVVKKVRSAGVKKIIKLMPTKTDTLIIRAHGSPLLKILQAKKLGYRIIDATCPMVKEIHRIASDMEKKGCSIVIIGDKKHDEVFGIAGQLKAKALIIGKGDKLPLDKIKRSGKLCIVVQSTQNIKDVLPIVEAIKKINPNLCFFNTICRPTRIKQAEIHRLPKENDAMIIIGSKTSANTKRLYEISRSINKKTWWVNSKNDIKQGWFKNVKKIGVTAGASTPEETIQKIVNFLRSL